MSSTPEAMAREAFDESFGGEPSTVGRAPARVELLGNHTDYNGGLVLAAAIDRSTVVVGRPIPGREARVFSANLCGLDAFAIDGIAPGGPESWARYVRGVAWAVQHDYGRMTSGFEAAIAGDVPIGAGLSSSASLQAAFALFLAGAGVSRWPVVGVEDEASRMDLARTLRRSENEFVGVASGLLDQFSVLFGEADHAFVLDCRDLGHEVLPLGSPAPAIVVCDSKTSRKLADGMYNVRRAECEQVADYFRERKGTARRLSLRDLTLEELQVAWDHLGTDARLRARHVLTENDRVTRGAEALRLGDVAGFGALMSASHASSRDDFRNSSTALDALIEAAEESPGFLGGKLSGAGWAGCTVNLVLPGQAPSFADSVRAGYARRTGLVPDVHICHAADGASTAAVG